jgi:hypothetical protein
MLRVAAIAECGIGVPVKWAHLALVSLAEPHDEALATRFTVWAPTKTASPIIAA